MKPAQRILIGAEIFLCILVLLFSLAGIAGTWVAGRAATTAVVDLLNFVDKTAQAGRNGISRVDARISNLLTLAGSIQAATNQLSQNITDKGLVLTLLPEGKEQELITAVQGIKDTFSQIRDTLDAALGAYRAIDNLPFISLPKPSTESLNAVSEKFDRLAQSIDALKAGIADVRSNIAGAVDKLSNAVAQANSLLSEGQASLAQVDSELAALQSTVSRVRELVPVIFTGVSIFLTLLLAWTAYTQVVVMQGAWKQLRKPASLEVEAGEGQTNPED